MYVFHPPCLGAAAEAVAWEGTSVGKADGFELERLETVGDGSATGGAVGATDPGASVGEIAGAVAGMADSAAKAQAEMMSGTRVKLNF